MITFKTKGNKHYVTHQIKNSKFTAVFDNLTDAWRFIFKLREGQRK